MFLLRGQALLIKLFLNAAFALCICCDAFYVQLPREMCPEKSQHAYVKSGQYDILWSF